MFFTKKSNLKTVTAGRDEKDVNACFTPGTALEDNYSVNLEVNVRGGALYDDYMPPSSFGEPTDAHATLRSDLVGRFGRRDPGKGVI
jgi:hypothetical protein